MVSDRIDRDPAGLAAVDENFATNVRVYREQVGLSQDELAQRMTELGFGFTQATVWKIEQGKRAVRIAEAVALMQALGLPSWMNLTRSPHTFRHDAQVQARHRQAAAAYEGIKEATKTYLHAQVELAMDALRAREADVAVNKLWLSWLDEPAERAVIEARVEYDRQDAIREELDRTVETILTALRSSGHEPTIRLNDFESVEPPRSSPER